MSKKLQSSFFRSLSLVVAVVLGALLSDSIGPAFGQPAPPPAATTPPATPAPSPSPPTAAAPIKETKETKETKEIKDHPSDWVELVGAIAWPLCLLLIIFMLVFSKTGKRMFGLFPKLVRKISAGGVEMEISEDAVEEIRAYLRDSFDELVARAKVEYHRMASVQQIPTHLSRVIDDALPRVLAANNIHALPANVRGTVHVPDIVSQATCTN